MCLYLNKGLSKFVHNQTVDEDIGRGVEDEENVRHKAEDDDPGGKPAQVRVLATENKSRVKFGFVARKYFTIFGSYFDFYLINTKDFYAIPN